MKANLLNGNTLAFIGDGILTLLVRDYLVSSGFTKTKDLSQKSIIFNAAKNQALFAYYLLDNKLLDEKELEIFRRGRNVSNKTIAKNVNVDTYNNASGLEAVFGYLYYENYDRLLVLFEKMKEFFNPQIMGQ